MLVEGFAIFSQFVGVFSVVAEAFVSFLKSFFQHLLFSHSNKDKTWIIFYMGENMPCWQTLVVNIKQTILKVISKTLN